MVLPPGRVGGLVEQPVLDRFCCLSAAAAASRPSPNSVGQVEAEADAGQRGQGIACVAEQVTSVHGFTSWKSGAGWLRSLPDRFCYLCAAAAASRPSPHSVRQVEPEADGGQRGQCIACVAEQVTSVHGFTSWKSAAGWLSSLSGSVLLPLCCGGRLAARSALSWPTLGRSRRRPARPGHSVRSGTGDERSWSYLLEECSGLVEQPVRIGSVTSVMRRPRDGQSALSCQLSRSRRRPGRPGHSVRSGTGDERSWVYLLEECGRAS